MFLVIDGFSKFVKLYPVCSASTREVLSCLKFYFGSYSRPKVLISDRGSAFTSKDFGSFLENNNIKHIKIATGSPQANGQVERVNRSLAPMIAKLTSGGSNFSLDRVLPDIEFALNNTMHRSIGTTQASYFSGFHKEGM